MLALEQQQAMRALVLMSVLLLLVAQMSRLRPWRHVLLIAGAVCLAGAIVGTVVMWTV